MKPTSRNALVRRALTGKDAHVITKTVFDGLEWTAAGLRPPGAPHTLYQLLNHMIFWQDWVLAWLDRRSPAPAEHASVGWPGTPAPSSLTEWTDAVRHFREGLGRLEARYRARPMAGRGRKTPSEMLAAIGAHNSYHAGQVVLLRQQAGHWPPPTGGLTW